MIQTLLWTFSPIEIAATVEMIYVLLPVKPSKKDTKFSRKNFFAFCARSCHYRDVSVMTSSQEVDGADPRQSLNTKEKMYRFVRHVHGSLVEAFVVLSTGATIFLSGLTVATIVFSDGDARTVHKVVGVVLLYLGVSTLHCVVPYVFLVLANEATEDI